ncbi:MAG: HEAT repeat domain-containing protein [Treponemataceae bacterium]|nr:HEAT repeat domain-containing protein [Treponemataceae bacterium]
MKMTKISTCLIAGLAFASMAFAQESETTVEGEYMSSADDVIITELANADERENKEVALQYLRDAVEGGNVSPDMMMALEHLAGEGINTQSRTKGRVMNNYPDIRREACIILGKVGTDDAAKTLNKIMKTDNEPMVLSAAVYALGEIGYNDNDEVSNAIAFYANKVETLNPTSSLALEVVNAYEKLSGNIKDIKPVVNSLQRIATDHHFVKPVRDRAREVLNKIRSSDKNSDSKK